MNFGCAVNGRRVGAKYQDITPSTSLSDVCASHNRSYSSQTVCTSPVLQD